MFLLQITGTLIITLSILISGCERSPAVLTLPEKLVATRQIIPDFADHQNIKEKKRAYFNYMNQKVRVANDEVWQERLFVQKLREKMASESLHEDEVDALTSLGTYYRLKTPAPPTDAYFAQLLTRIDVVPASLVLAQSANESAWGSSRFARAGRNFFGIWCYEPGCGLTPLRRNAGAQQEVKKFQTVLDGVRYYVRTINSGRSYAKLRDLRAAARVREEKPTGVELADGLTLYSERGGEYVDEIKRMIRQNELASYSITRQTVAVLR